MFEIFSAALSASEIISTLNHRIESWAALADSYFSEVQNLRAASVILMLLALILFLFLVVILYVKSVISFLKNDKAQDKNSLSSSDEIFSEEDEARLNSIMEEEELERELQRELDLARAEREEISRKEADKKEQKKEAKIKARSEAKARKKAEQKERLTQAEIKGEKAEPVIDLDWKKGKLQELEQTTPAPVLDSELLSYHQTSRPLKELPGLIIDMAARGVDDLKIAQTVMFRNQGKNSEDDILQTIDAVKEFIRLCADGKFAALPGRDKLPQEEEALFHLAEGDPAPALALMETLMDYKTDQSAGQTNLAKKEEMFKEISSLACCFGTLAALNDVLLATGAFELAIELYPTNINAWSRLGDMYRLAESTNKAVWAYKNILDVADEEIYAQQVANAEKMMSQYLYAQGSSLQAAKLFNSSKVYYDTLGINRRLDRQEADVVEIIEKHQKEGMPETIRKLLNQGNGAVYEFL